MIQYGLHPTELFHYSKRLETSQKKIDFSDNAPPIVFQQIEKRFAMKMDTIIAVVGAKRTGKTNTAINIAMTLDKKWSLDQLFFEPVDFLKYWVKHEEQIEQRWIVLDECGITLNAWEWQSTMNVIFNKLLQRGGYKRINIIMTMPHLAFLVKPARLMLNYIIRTMRQGLAMSYKVCVHEAMGKGYLRTLDFPLIIKKVPNDIWYDYEKRKREWNEKVDREDIKKFDKKISDEIELEQQSKDFHFLKGLTPDL